MNNYLHGGDANYYFNKFNIHKRDIIDFSTNINPLGTPGKIKAIWQDLLFDAERYPTIDGFGVKEFYCEKFNLDSDSIAAANGASEAIYLIPTIFNIKNVLLIEPSFYEYKRTLKLRSIEIHTLQLTKSSNFNIGFNEIDNALTSNIDAIIIGNPNNPTSTLLDREMIIMLADKYKDKLFFIDESFIQFAEHFEEFSLINKLFLRKNIIVIHSLTKFYALAGLRIGGFISHPDTIKTIETNKMPWSVNRIAERVSASIAGCDEYDKSTMSLIKKEKKFISMSMKNNKYITLYPSNTNFYLAEFLGSDLDDLLKYLLTMGIYVRDCRNFDYLDGNFFRFAVLDNKSNKRLIDAVSSYA